MKQASKSLFHLFQESRAVYLFGRIYYFICETPLDLDSLGLTSLGVELEESGIPQAHVNKLKHSINGDTVYSYDPRESGEIVFEIETILNTKIPRLIDKDKCAFKAEFDEIIIVQRKSKSDYNLHLFQQKQEIFSTVIQLFKLLTGLSSYVSQEGSKYLFWINSVEPNGTSSAKVVEFTFDVDSINSLPQKLENIRFPILGEGSLHNHEKSVLFKRAVVKNIGAIESPKASDIVNLSKQIDDDYDREYSAYISKFGLDKSLNELHDKSIEIIGKISDTIQSTALKLLIVPATMLATILMRQSNLPSYGFKMVFIVIVVIVLVIILHDETKRYINKLEENGQQLLDSIINLNAGTNHQTVEQSQTRVKKSLTAVAKETKERIDRYRLYSILALAIWLLIIF